MIVVLTPEAEEDLERIGDHIAQFNSARAETFVDELVERCLLLKDMPLRFQLVPGHEQTGIRRMPHGNYAVYYRAGENIVSILHVLNTAQDHEAVLFPDPETP